MPGLTVSPDRCKPKEDRRALSGIFAFFFLLFGLLLGIFVSTKTALLACPLVQMTFPAHGTLFKAVVPTEVTLALVAGNIFTWPIRYHHPFPASTSSIFSFSTSSVCGSLFYSAQTLTLTSQTPGYLGSIHGYWLQLV